MESSDNAVSRDPVNAGGADWRVMLLLLDTVDTADGLNGSPESAACINSFSVDCKQTFGPQVTCRYLQSRQPHLTLAASTHSSSHS